MLVVYAGPTGGLVREFGEAAHDFGIRGGDGGVGGRGGSDGEFGG